MADAEIASYLSRANASSHSETQALSSLSAFQRNADRYPQLSAEAQLELHGRWVAGQQARADLATGLRGRAAAKARRAASDGERAMEYLVASNFRLVLLISREQAERRYGRDRALGVLSDLVAEANVALTEAVVSFDPERGLKFSTWAAHQIRSAVRTALSEGDTPFDVPSSWRRLKRIAAVRIPKLADRLGRQPSVEEIQHDLTAYCTSWALDKLTPPQKELPMAKQRELAGLKLRKQGMEAAIRDVEKVLKMTAAPTSLDKPTTDDGSRTVGDTLTVDSSEDAIDPLDMAGLKEAVDQALADLTARERRIIWMRYGFEDGKMHTYGEICTQFEVTAERIRQIEKKVLAHLRSDDSPLRGRLAAFLPGMEDVDLDARAEQLSKSRRRR